MDLFFFFFFVVKDIDFASYADGSASFLVERNIDSVLEFLEQVSDALFNWFKNIGLETILISAMY